MNTDSKKLAGKVAIVTGASVAALNPELAPKYRTELLPRKSGTVPGF